LGLFGMPIDVSIYATGIGCGTSAAKLPDGRTLPPKTVSGMTIEALCEATKEIDPWGKGIDPKGLRQTISYWNRNLPHDPLWGRTHVMTRFGTPPFYACMLWPAMLNESTGIKINGKGQVINKEGNPIPRLYCAGRNSGGQYGQMYTCGTALATGTIMGKVAGKTVASERRWVE